MFEAASLEEALEALGEIMEDRGDSADLLLVGGGALLICGHITRPTKDLDVAAKKVEGAYVSSDPFPAGLTRAVRDVADALGLVKDWLNPGPSELMRFGLPRGIEGRWTSRTYGSLTVRLPSRLDHIHFKVFAAADQWPQSRHLDDLRILEPTQTELLQAAKWCCTHDTSQGFRDVLLFPLLQSFGVDPSELEDEPS